MMFHGFFALFNGSHARHARTDVQGGGQIAELFGRPGGIHFHAAIIQIPREANQAVSGSSFYYEIAVADTLHRPFNKPSFGGVAFHG
jgi:hypothetical protein